MELILACPLLNRVPEAAIGSLPCAPSRAAESVGRGGEEIPERRLRALPFAIRSRDCEEALEVAGARRRPAV
jgi:Prokaryotic dksA/traR C4-type zinc finger